MQSVLAVMEPLEGTSRSPGIIAEKGTVVLVVPPQARPSGVPA